MGLQTAEQVDIMKRVSRTQAMIASAETPHAASHKLSISCKINVIIDRNRDDK
jgi:hypothetical protein